MEISKELIKRLRTAWGKLTPGQQESIRTLMAQAYEVASGRLALARGERATPNQPPDAGTAPNTETEGLALAYALLFADPSGLVSRLGEGYGAPELEPAPPGTVDDEGQIWWFGKYEQLDPGWLASVVVWLEYLGDKLPFPHGSNVVQIPDGVTIALVGDWGTGTIPGDGPTPSLEIAQAIEALQPDYTIHLGDTYYAGTNDEEKENFLAGWVPGSLGTFALNSNHEMYPGGRGYFETLLTDPTFAAQKGLSYFALENSNWIIVGLDSAYFANADGLYSTGNLDSTYQIPFLETAAQRAQQTGRKVIVYTHHNGLSYDGTETAPLWGQVTSAFAAGSGPAYWYWGHVHIGAVYPQRDGVWPRCSGHGGVPWGYAGGLEKAMAGGTVSWFEQARLVARPPQVVNGFTLLSLSGASLEEAYYDQSGNLSWSSKSADEAETKAHLEKVEA